MSIVGNFFDLEGDVIEHKVVAFYEASNKFIAGEGRITIRPHKCWSVVDKLSIGRTDLLSTMPFAHHATRSPASWLLSDRAWRNRGHVVLVFEITGDSETPLWLRSFGRLDSNKGFIRTNYTGRRPERGARPHGNSVERWAARQVGGVYDLK